MIFVKDAGPSVGCTMSHPSPSLLKRMNSPAPRFTSNDATDSSPEVKSVRRRNPDAGTSTAANVFEGTTNTARTSSIAA